MLLRVHIEVLLRLLNRLDLYKCLSTRGVLRAEDTQCPWLAHLSGRCFLSSCGGFTLDVLSNKHINFGQGLDFLKLSEGSRGENEEKQKTS